MKFAQGRIIVDKKEMNDNRYVAQIKCPYCDEAIVVFHKLSNSKYGTWNTGNFSRHLVLVHINLKEDDAQHAQSRQDPAEKTDNAPDNSLDDYILIQVPGFSTDQTTGDQIMSDKEDIKDDMNGIL